MSWNKALVIGFCIYILIYFVSFLIFVCLGSGYTLSNLANKIAEVLAFPTGTGKNYNFFISALFWTVLLSVVIKIVGKQ